MSDSSTVGVDLGGSVVTASGGLTGQFLQLLAAEINAAGYTFAPYAKGDSVPPASFLTLTDDPAVTLGPTDPGINTAGFASTIFGGGAVTSIISTAATLQYQGGAGVVFADGSSGDIVDTGTTASVVATDGTYTVLTTGVDSLLLGGAVASVTATTLGQGGTSTLQGGVDYFAGQTETIVATGGANTVFAGGSDVFFATGTNVFFGTGDVSTFIGGSGSDTINTGGGDLIFVGNTADLVVGVGGSDTLAGGTVAPTVFAGENEQVTLVSTTPNAILVDNGRNATLDGSGTSGGNNFFASASFGNATLIGAAAGNGDAFFVAKNLGLGPDATISIVNWHVGDSLTMTGYDSVDTTIATANVAAGHSSFTLTDGTTVSFTGNHPTTGTGGTYA